jgi:hypothetical protein
VKLKLKSQKQLRKRRKTMKIVMKKPFLKIERASQTSLQHLAGTENPKFYVCPTGSFAPLTSAVLVGLTQHFLARKSSISSSDESSSETTLFGFSISIFLKLIIVGISEPNN